MRARSSARRSLAVKLPDAGLGNFVQHRINQIVDVFRFTTRRVVARGTTRSERRERQRDVHSVSQVSSGPVPRICTKPQARVTLSQSTASSDQA